MLTMKGRLVTTIISTIAEEAAALFLGLWVLPRLGIHVPILVLVGLMVLWLLWSVLTYETGARALSRRPVGGLTDMKGTTGVVVKTLHPEGMVKIKGELWSARCTTGRLEAGARVIVVDQEGLRLSVVPESGGRPAVDKRHDQ
jgi:membrane-bound ClpP family serine protease